MSNSLWIWIAIFSLLAFAIIVASIDFASAQQVITNSTPIAPNVVLLPQQTVTPTNNGEQGIWGLASLIVTGVAIPAVGLFLAKKDEKTKEVAKEGHDQNEFRLEAASSTLKEINNSIYQTDKGNLELATIVQKFMQVFRDYPQLEKLLKDDKYAIKGISLTDTMDQFVAASKDDIEAYYDKNSLPEDKFDTCNDPIVQNITAVRNKSKK